MYGSRYEHFFAKDKPCIYFVLTLFNAMFISHLHISPKHSNEFLE